MGSNLLPRVGLALGVLLAVGVVAVLAVGLVNRGGQPLPAEPPPGPRSAPGWEIKYNATLALARRGSTRTPLEILGEMLDEDQQRRNSRITINQGKNNVPDEVAARETVLAALQAIHVLHEKQPEMDLSTLDPAIDKLGESPNPVIRTEARKIRSALSTDSQSGE